MRTILMIILVMVITQPSLAETTCTLVGQVINRESKFILLRKYSENAKVYYENPVKIKIKKGIFSYTFSYVETEAYELAFEDELKTGSWRSIIFFPDRDTIQFKLFSMTESNHNVVSGGDLNREYADFLRQYNALFDQRRQELSKEWNRLIGRDELNTKEYNEILKQLHATRSDDYDALDPIYQKKGEMEKTNARYTEKAMKLYVKPYDSLQKAELKWKYNYINAHTTIAAYYLIWNDVLYLMKDNIFITQLVVAAFPIFEKKYPEHIYTKKISTQLSGIESIVVGGRYIDFKAPTLEGDTVRLSTKTNNPVTLIDFWGSWCGPCIAKSRLVVPVYEKYKDKGFGVIGIAREFKNTDAMKKRLAKEQFSWLHLVELDDQQNIWNLYGISNGTGLMVLIDSNGVILAIDPSPEDLEKILVESL